MKLPILLHLQFYFAPGDTFTGSGPTISGTDKAKAMLHERMEILKKSKYDSIQVFQTGVENRNIYSVVVLSSNKGRYMDDN